MSTSRPGAQPSLDDIQLQSCLRELRTEIDGDGEVSPTVAELVVHGDPRELRVAGLSLLVSADPFKRILGTRLLRELEDDHAPLVEALLSQLHVEVDPKVVPWLLSALGWLGTRSELEVILSYANSEDPHSRWIVADASSKLAGESLGEEALPVLLATATDPVAEVRFSAIFELTGWAKAGNGSPRIQDALRSAQLDDDEGIRATAQDGLAISRPQQL